MIVIKHIKKHLTIRVIRVILFSRGEGMQRTLLIKKLMKGGYKIMKGGKHGMAKHPDRPGKIPIPHGSQINDFTAKKILKDAGLE